MIDFLKMNRLQVDMIAILNKMSIDENTIEYVVTKLPYEKQVIKIFDYLMNNHVTRKDSINKTIEILKI